jgi:hypothetical protein
MADCASVAPACSKALATMVAITDCKFAAVAVSAWMADSTAADD